MQCEENRLSIVFFTRSKYLELRDEYRARLEEAGFPIPDQEWKAQAGVKKGSQKAAAPAAVLRALCSGGREGLSELVGRLPSCAVGKAATAKRTVDVAESRSCGRSGSDDGNPTYQGSFL